MGAATLQQLLGLRRGPRERNRERRLVALVYTQLDGMYLTSQLHVRQ